MTTAQLEAIGALEDATKAMLKLIDVMKSSTEDGDEWTRLPSASGKCAISGRSRSWINTQDDIRKKTVRGARYYAANDVRAMIEA